MKYVKVFFALLIFFFSFRESFSQHEGYAHRDELMKWWSDPRFDNILYIEIYDWPKDGKLVLPGVLNQVQKASFLSDKGKKLPVQKSAGAIIISLPPVPPDSIKKVICVELKGRIDFCEPPAIKSEFTLLVDSMRVELVSKRENTEIRYEFNGSEPTANSRKYTAGIPVIVKGSCILSARCFREGKPVSGTNRKTFKLIYPYVAKGVSGLKPGLRFRYYEGIWDSIPKFSKMNSVKEGIVDDFTLIPKNHDENFGFVYNGYVKVPETNIYDFYVSSDEGSRLYIDDKLVVNNDGLHGILEKEGIIPLNKGHHKIRVEYFESTGDENLNISVRSPGKEKRKIPKDWLFQ